MAVDHRLCDVAGACLFRRLLGWVQGLEITLSSAPTSAQRHSKTATSQGLGYTKMRVHTHLKETVAPPPKSFQNATTYYLLSNKAI